MLDVWVGRVCFGCRHPVDFHCEEHSYDDGSRYIYCEGDGTGACGCEDFGGEGFGDGVTFVEPELMIVA